METLLVKKIHFSCGHRIFNPDWTQEKNKIVFADDYSEFGFGHNFTLELAVGGNVSSETGHLEDFEKLQDVLKDVTDPLDHKFLNEDVEYFTHKVPTTENIALYCFEQSQKALTETKLKLKTLRLHEGQELYVEIEGSQ